MSDMNVWQQLIEYFGANGGYVVAQLWRHFLMTIYGVLFACVIGIPIGIYISRHRKWSPWVIGLANIIQTIPSLALMSILMVLLGLGVNTVITTIFLYSLLPIIANTYAGMTQLNPDILDAARGVGMTKFERLRQVELPLALPIIMAGVRNALIVGIGIAAIGSFIGAGGMGDILIRGTNATNGAAIVLAGVIPIAGMAMLIDQLLAYIEKRLGHHHS